MIRIFCAIFIFYSTASAAFEDIPQIHVSEIIPPSLAQTISYRVEDGRLAGKYIRFNIDSEFGELTVDSLPLLITRIREISILFQAVNQLNQQNSRSGEYNRGKYSVSADSALDILARPMSTASDVAGQVRNNLENSTQDVSPELYMKYIAGGDEADDPVITMHKRNIASQWGLDVYSSNPMIQKFLMDTASARAAGKIAAGAPDISRGDIAPFKFANRDLELEIGLLIKNKKISELEDINNQLLSGMNVRDGLRLMFLHHKMYSPRHKTSIIHYLNLLKDVVNRSAFIEQAVNADSESAVLDYEIAAMLLVYYNDKVSPLLKLHSGNDVLEAITRNNHVLFLTMTDLIYWSEDNGEFFKQLNREADQAGFSAKEIITAGEITEEASTRLKDMGFTLRQKLIF